MAFGSSSDPENVRRNSIYLEKLKVNGKVKFLMVYFGDIFNMVLFKVRRFEESAAASED
jgi:hypothetical protein